MGLIQVPKPKHEGLFKIRSRFIVSPIVTIRFQSIRRDMIRIIAFQTLLWKEKEILIIPRWTLSKIIKILGIVNLQVKISNSMSHFRCSTSKDRATILLLSNPKLREDNCLLHLRILRGIRCWPVKWANLNAYHPIQNWCLLIRRWFLHS